ncbi:MAG TPA: hypothetical protein ENK52_01525 [Saprospiraceae bacterium]|nr:hypothetical protein [Saprospiraceae bacterium]
MKKAILFLLCTFFFLQNCSTPSQLKTYGRHYQKHRDSYSLQKVIELFELGADTADVKIVLGEGIDMGFDYRYLLDSVGENGCAVGAVFHINDLGKIDQKWLGEICE